MASQEFDDRHDDLKPTDVNTISQLMGRVNDQQAVIVQRVLDRIIDERRPETPTQLLEDDIVKLLVALADLEAAWNFTPSEAAERSLSIKQRIRTKEKQLQRWRQLLPVRGDGEVVGGGGGAAAASEGGRKRQMAIAFLTRKSHVN